MSLYTFILRFPPGFHHIFYFSTSSHKQKSEKKRERKKWNIKNIKINGKTSLSRATSVFVIHSDRFRLEIQEECDNLLWSRIFISLLFFQKWKSNTNLVEKGVQSMTTPGKKNTVSLRGEGGPCHPEINDILTIWSNMFVRFAFIHLLFEWSFFLSQILCAHLLPLISWHFGRAHHDCTLGHLYCPKEEEEEGAPNFCSILRALSGKMSWTLGKGWNPFAYIIGHTLRLVFS